MPGKEIELPVVIFFFLKCCFQWLSTVWRVEEVAAFVKCSLKGVINQIQATFKLIFITDSSWSKQMGEPCTISRENIQT